MNYFEFYPGDYLRDTTRLTLSEHGAYLRLLMAYYSDEQPLPAENDALFRIVSAQNAAEKSAVLKVADLFFPVTRDGVRHNGRADAEIAKAQGRMDASPTGRKATQAERAKRYRERRSAMFALLRDHGITMDFNVKAEELEAAVMKLAGGGNRHIDRHIERDEKRDECDGVTRDMPRDVTASRPQTPDPNKQQEQKKEREKTTAVEIDTWIGSLDGEDAIPGDDSIFSWAEKTGIPLDFLALSWITFRDDMRERHKRQKDWRAHYRNAVKRNWYKLWWFDPTGECKLTTTGEQAKRAAA